MESYQKTMERLYNPDLASLLLRLALGVVFAYAGWTKFYDMRDTVGFFTAIGIPSILAFYVTYIELLGGIAMILGILVRYAAFLNAINMLVAIWLLRTHGFSLAHGGFEYNFVLALTGIALVLIGEGKYSLSRLMKKEK